MQKKVFVSGDNFSVQRKRNASLSQITTTLENNFLYRTYLKRNVNWTCGTNYVEQFNKLENTPNPHARSVSNTDITLRVQFEKIEIVYSYNIYQFLYFPFFTQGLLG